MNKLNSQTKWKEIEKNENNARTGQKLWNLSVTIPIPELGEDKENTQTTPNFNSSGLLWKSDWE